MPVRLMLLQTILWSSSIARDFIRTFIRAATNTVDRPGQTVHHTSVHVGASHARLT